MTEPATPRDTAHRGRRQTDQILDGWTWARVIKIGTAIGLLWAGWSAATAFVAAKVATRQELNDVTQKVDTLDQRVTALTKQREGDALAATQDRQMLRGLVKAQCLAIPPETAALIELPCSALGITPSRRR